jgi:hypothetical protein
MSDKVEIVIQGEDRASSDIDNVIAKIRSLEQGNQGASASFKDVGSSASGTSSNLGKMGMAAGVAAGAFLAFQGVSAIIGGVSDKVMELNGELARFQNEGAKLDRIVKNVSGSMVEAQRVTEAMERAISDMADRTGSDVPMLTSVMSELTTRFQDGELAIQNYERAMNLMGLTGQGASSSARALAEAVQGNFSPLQRAGVLTLEQVNYLNSLEDANERVAAAMKLVDQQVEGFIDATPLAQEASDRLASSLSRIKAASAEILGVDKVVNFIARSVEGATKQVEDFAKAWSTGARSIKQSLNEIDQATKKAFEEIDTTSQAFQQSLGESSLRDLRIEYERTIDRINRAAQATGGWVETGRGAVTQQEALNLATKWYEERVEQIRVQRGMWDKEVIDASTARIRQLEREQRILEEQDVQRRFRLESDSMLQELAERRLKALNEISDANGNITNERQRQRIEREFELETQNLILRREQELQGLQTKGAQEIKGLSDLIRQSYELRTQALLQEDGVQRAILNYHARMLQIEDAKLDSAQERFEVAQAEFQLQEAVQRVVGDQIRQNDRDVQDFLRNLQRGLDEVNREASRIQTGTDFRPMSRSVFEVMAEEAEFVRKRFDEVGQSVSTSMSLIASSTRTTSDLLANQGRQEQESLRQSIQLLEERRRVARESGQDTEGFDAQIRALQGENVLLAENIRLQQERIQSLSQVQDQLGLLGTSLTDIAGKQWDFKEASDATVQATQALVGVLGSAVQASGAGIKERAAWEAAFHTAAAGGALAMGLAFGSPNFFAASAGHAVAATQMGLIAGGAIKAPSSRTGGGGARGSSGQSINRQSIVDEALRAAQGAQTASRGDINVTFNFGSNNVTLEDSVETQRRISRAIVRELEALRFRRD